MEHMKLVTFMYCGSSLKCRAIESHSLSFLYVPRVPTGSWYIIFLRNLQITSLCSVGRTEWEWIVVPLHVGLLSLTVSPAFSLSLSLCMCVCVYVCKCVSVYVCMYVCKYLSMYVCIYIYIYIYRIFMMIKFLGSYLFSFSYVFLN